MFHGHYDAMVQFASEGTLAEQLACAKGEYFERTGELFESDANFERRMASFLEWYVFDREMEEFDALTPAKLYIRDHVTDSQIEKARLEEVASSMPSLFEYRRVKNGRLYAIDLLSNRKINVFERREPAGLEAGDILEARLVDYDNELFFTTVWSAHPREARRAIVKAAKALRKSDDSRSARINFVHRVARFSNRCDRYKHVSPKQIFEEL